MSNALSDEELAAWRAKRTGKALPTNPTASDPTRGPEAPRSARNPLDGLQNLDAPSPPAENDPAPAPASRAPASGSEEDLRNQLTAALGRLGPAQRQLEEMRGVLEAQAAQLLESQQQLAEIQAAQATAKAKQAAENFDPFEGMSKDEIEMIDPTALSTFAKMARNLHLKHITALESSTADTLRKQQERETKARNEFIHATAESLGLIKLGQDVKFTQWMAQDDSADLLLNRFVNALDISTAKSLEPKLRIMLKRYERDTSTSNRDPDPTSRLSAHLDRDSNRSSNGGKRVITPEDARAIRNEAARLTRARQFKEAEKLLSQLNS